MRRRGDPSPRSVLERKVRLLFGLTLLVLLAASFYVANRRLEGIIRQEHRRTARATVPAVLMIDHAQWTAADRPSVPGRILGFRHFLESNQPLSHRYFVRGREPARTEEPPDPFERVAIHQLIHGQPAEEGGYTERYRYIPGEDFRTYQYLTVLKNHASCQGQGCHAAPDPRVPGGDVLAVMSLKLRFLRTDDLLTINRVFLFYLAFVTAVVSLVVLYAIVRVVITRPVTHLKRVSDRVRTGDRSVRTDLNTRDELEDFGRAFNRMLDAIDAGEAELRRLNADLDRKVEELSYTNLALYELNRAKSEFVATMTHEFRTPLNAILGFSEVLRERTGDRLDANERRYLENIQSSGEHLLTLINSILDLARIESGKMELNLERLSVGDLCRDLAGTFEPLTGVRRLTLTCHVPDGLPLVVTDRGKLRQVLYNLLGNAVKFTPAGGRIELRVAADNGRIRIDVSDTGIGIPKDQLDRVFDRFRQVDGSASRPYDGSGLGLAIVHELVRLLKGEVSVTSEVGKGSTFTVLLPLEIPGAAAGGVVEVPLGEGLDLTRARRVFPGEGPESGETVEDQDHDEEAASSHQPPG